MEGLMQDSPLVVTRILDYAARFHGEQTVVSWRAEGGTIEVPYRDLHRRARLCSLALKGLGVRSVGAALLCRRAALRLPPPSCTVAPHAQRAPESTRMLRRKQGVEASLGLRVVPGRGQCAWGAAARTRATQPAFAFLHPH